MSDKQQTIVAFTFDHIDKARAAYQTLMEMDKEDDAIHIIDAAIAHRGEKRVTLEQMRDLEGGKGAISGGVIGMLTGALVMGVSGGIVGAAIGGVLLGLYGQLRDIGMDDHLMREVSFNAPVNSATLFVLYSGEADMGYLEALKKFDATLAYSTLPEDITDRARQLLAESPVDASIDVELDKT